MAEENLVVNPQPQPTENAQTAEVKPAPQTTETPPQPSTPLNPGKGNKGGLIKKIVFLLILILIIAGIVFAGMPFYKSWQAKKRDSQRKADIQMLQKALEKLKTKTIDQKYYPGAMTDYTMVKTGIIDKLPQDPINKPPYTYVYQSLPSNCTANCTNYSLFACLENKNDADGKTPKGSCKTKIYEVTK